jgi:hypothetical protein
MFVPREVVTELVCRTEGYSIASATVMSEFGFPTAGHEGYLQLTFEIEYLHLACAPDCVVTTHPFTFLVHRVFLAQSAT